MTGARSYGVPDAWVGFLVLLAGLWGAVLFLLWDSFQHMASLWWHREIYHHGLIIPFVSLSLVFQKRSDLVAHAPQASWRALPVWLLALALWGVGDLMEARLVTHVGAVMVLILSVPLLGGWGLAHKLIFPLGFLLLAIPFGEDLIPFLQMLTAQAAIALLQVLTIPITTEGVLIYTDFGNFEIAQACAGVRFFLTSAVVGLLLSHLLFKHWGRRVAMLVAALVIPIIANIIRVVTIILLAKAFDVSFAKQIDHLIYGWVFLGFVLFLVIATAYRFSDRPAYGGTTAVPGPLDATVKIWPSGVLFGVALTAVIGVATATASSRALGTAALVKTPPSFGPGFSASCSDCQARLLDPGFAKPWQTNIQSGADHKQVFRMGGALIHAQRHWLPADAPYSNIQIFAFIAPLPGYDQVPGMPTARFYTDSAGLVWQVVPMMNRTGSKLLILRRFVRDGRLIDSVWGLKRDRARAKLNGARDSVDYTLLIAPNIQSFEDGLAILGRFLAERQLLTKAS